MLVQVLPAHELSDGETSPYGALSAFAIDPIYVDVEAVTDLSSLPRAEVLGADGERELARVRALPSVDYAAVRALKRTVLRAAFRAFVERELSHASSERAENFAAFAARESAWLQDHALYMALRYSHAGYGWSTWPERERDRAAEVVAVVRDDVRAMASRGALGLAVLEQMYVQWIVHEQWVEARRQLAALGVVLMGDMPFIVGGESADVWSHRDQFRTDVSLGAPPDDFSADGQSWGLPAYDWNAMDRDGLAWLRMRARHTATLFDRFRIDHVVGFFRQWVRRGTEAGEFDPAHEGAQQVRGEKVLMAMMEAAGPQAVIAEDLGVIPPFVRETMSRLGLPGYKVLPWERDEHSNLRDPRGFPECSVATWSTHDTSPITRWWHEFEPWERERVASMAGFSLDADAETRELALLRVLFSARSQLCLVLIQELLGDRSRINTPGTVNGDNWTWRLPRPIEDLAKDTGVQERFAKIRQLAVDSGRTA